MYINSRELNSPATWLNESEYFEGLSVLNPHCFFTVDNYDWLVNGTAQGIVDRFVEEEHSFDEYTEVRESKTEVRFDSYTFCIWSSIWYECNMCVCVLFHRKWKSSVSCLRRLSVCRR